MKVSIVIRTFNSGEGIHRVLGSVGSQFFEDREVVIVDSGSTDGTLEAIRKYPHAYVDYSGRRFTYSGSLNAGCEAARGEYIVCLSHHCVPLHQEWLGNLVAALDGDTQLAGAWGPLVLEPAGYGVGEEGVKVMDLEEFYRRPNWGLQNPNSIIRRDLWLEHPFSEAVERCEDQEWAHHFMQRGYKTAMVRGAQVLYAPKFGLREYAGSTYRNLIALNRMFGYVPTTSLKEVLKRSARLSGAVLLGERAPRPSALAVSGMVGRWIADKSIKYGGGYERVKRVKDNGAVASRGLALLKRKARGARRRAALARRALDGSLRAETTLDSSETTVFFLVGEMRSGTSWLSETINTHPEVFCKGEGSFFGRDQATEEIPVYDGPSPSLHNAVATNEGFRTWHSLLWNGWGRGDLDEDIHDLTRMTIDYFLTKDAAPSGKKIVGDKSPLHTDHVDEIHGFYPEARVLHIVRDGRDVAVSLMHHFWRMAKDRGGIFELEPEELRKRDAYLADPDGFLATGESIFTEERLRQMAVRWSRRVSKASGDGARLFGRNYYQLRYEDLLLSPEKHLAEIFGLLGASADEVTVARCVEQNRFEKLAKRSKGQEDAGSFFRKGVAGDWRGVFTPRDREVYEDIAGVALLDMGYPLD